MLKRLNFTYLYIVPMFFFFAVVLMQGCSSIPRKPVVARKIPKVHEGKKVNTEKIIAYLENQPELKSFKARGKINIRTSKWSGSGRVFIAGVYPSRVHFEVFDFFGNPKWIINATRKGVEALNVATKELFVSRNTRDLMNGLFAIPAGLDEIFFFFTGQRPPVNWSEAKISPSADGTHLVLETTNKSADDWLLFLTVPGLSIKKTIIWHRKDHTRLKISFDDYTHSDNYFVPYTRILSVRDAQMKIKYKDFDVNQACNDSLFRLKRPRNTKVIWVGNLKLSN